MFLPPIFREDRPAVMHGLMRAHPFATLVCSVDGTLTADHVPLALHPELSENGTLRGHLSAANPLAKAAGPLEALAIFQGPHAYVTPSWYPSKQEHGKVVPTWNYAVVHARGPLRFEQEPDWLMAHLADLSARQENHRADPWAITDAPPDFMARQLKGIIGVEIEIAALDGKWKVSQNRSAPDRQGVVQGLLGEDAAQAAAMSDLVQQATSKG